MNIAITAKKYISILKKIVVQWLNEAKIFCLLLKDIRRWDKSKPIVGFHMEAWLYRKGFLSRQEGYMKVAAQEMGCHGIRGNYLSPYCMRILSSIVERKDHSLYFTAFCMARGIIAVPWAKLKCSEKTRDNNVDANSLPFSPVMIASYDSSMRCKKAQKAIASKGVNTFKEYIELVDPSIIRCFQQYSSLRNEFVRLCLQKPFQFFCAPQLTYGTYYLVSCAFECSVDLLLFEHMYFEMATISPDKKGYFTRMADYFKYEIESLDSDYEDYKAQAVNALSSRIGGVYSSSTMAYMDGFNLNENDVEAPEGCCILFMHCFSDAPNGMILDPNERLFSDYFEHTYEVIQIAKKLNIPLLIKPHPANTKFFSDKPKFESIQRLVAGLADSDWFVQWVESDVANSSFMNLVKPFAITAHGSVMLECGFMGIPVAHTTTHQWEHSHFTRRLSTFRDVEDYMMNPYENYDPLRARESAIAYQAFMESLVWSERPGCIDLYKTQPGSLTDEQAYELYSRRVTI